MKKITPGKNVILTSFFYILTVTSTVALINSCSKRTCNDKATEQTGQTEAKTSAIKTPGQQYKTLTQSVTIANIRKSGDGRVTKVMFNQLAEMFSVYDAAVIADLKDALANHKTIQVTFDPWQGTVVSMSATGAGKAASQVTNTGGQAYNVDLSTMTNDVIDNIPSAAVINTTTPGLTNVIPDFATAQLMFDYITHQACAIPGPYGIDQCISFQYCQDGCYARAHKMCWIINNKYHYDTHKIFSFANAGSDQLCVKAQKWGGCCVNWWYHVAPIVNVKTPSGVKSYVFDAAMFDQPVLLSTWLHAQENPACVPSGDVPHVSMINIQPTSSYWPSDGTGYVFGTDPMYTSTNSTMASYSPLITCP